MEIADRVLLRTLTYDFHFVISDFISMSVNIDLLIDSILQESNLDQCLM